MNIVALVGNLATDPELRTTSGGKQVCTFRLAVSRASGNEADFFTAVAWENQADICAKYLTIGRRIAISGRLHHTTWVVEPESDGDGDGAEQQPPQRRSRVEVVIHRMDMLDAPKQPREKSSDPFAGERVAERDDQPAAPEFAVT